MTVGSESLYRRALTGEQLNNILGEVKALIPGTKIGSAESWNNYTDGGAAPLYGDNGNADFLWVTPLQCKSVMLIRSSEWSTLSHIGKSKTSTMHRAPFLMI